MKASEFKSQSTGKNTLKASQWGALMKTNPELFKPATLPYVSPDTKLPENAPYSNEYKQYVQAHNSVQQFREDYKKTNEALDGYNSLVDGMIAEQKAKAPSHTITILNGMGQDSTIGAGLSQWAQQREKAKTDANQYKVTDKWSLQAKQYLAQLYDESPEKALEFASDMNYSIETGEMYELGKKYPIMGGVVSVATNLGNMLEYPLNLAEYAGQKIKGVENAELRRSTSADITSALRSGGANNEIISSFKIGDWNAGGFVYNGLLSLADMMVVRGMGEGGADIAAKLTSKLGKGKIVKWVNKFLGNLLGGSVLGTSAAASATNDVLDRGGTAEQAIHTGTAAFFIETLTETFSLSELDMLKDTGAAGIKAALKAGGKGKWAKILGQTAKSVGISMGTNASEEYFSEVANILYDTLANGDISQFSTQVRNYMAEGMSEEEARKKVAVDFAYQTLEAAASGAFIGLLSGGGDAALNYVTENAAYKNSQIWDNEFLTENDADEYMKTGKTLHTRNKKQRMLEAGKNPVLTSLQETKNFILSVIQGKASGEVRAFAKVGSKLSDAVKAVNPKLDISGKYLEISADDLREAYKKHSQPKESGDIALSEDDFTSIPEHLNEFSNVLGTETYNGRVEIHIARETENGYIQILTVSSNERNSVQVKKLIGVSKSKFQQKYAKKIERSAGSLRGQTAKAEVSNPSTTAQHTAGTLSTNSINQKGSSVNNNISKNGGDNTENSVSQSTAEGTDGEKLETMSFDNDEAGVGEPLSHEQKVILNTRGEAHTLTNKQRALNRIAEKLGVKLVWDIDGDPALFGNGYYENGVIHMNKQAKAKATVFAHEYIHHIEQSKLWPAFKKFIEGTQAYKNWITLRGNNSDVEQATKNYKARLETNYKKAGKELADSDIIANFMAERFFGGDFEGNVEAEADAESLLREFAKNDKWYHNIIRFARQMISHFKGDKIQEELYKMERILLKARKEVQKNTPTNTGGRKYSIDPSFASKFDEWDKKTTGARLRVGKTSKVLQGLGVDIKNIYWDTSKIKTVQEQHPAMTDDVIKQVPNILEYPILVMESATVNGRLTLFGEVYDAANVPVLAILELNPTDKNGHSLDMIKIASAYGKNTNPQGLINKSKILYVDPNKNRTTSWLTANGLQLPRPSTNGGSINSINQNGSSVNTHYMQNGVKNAKNHSKNSVTPASEAETIARLAAEGRADEYKTDNTVSKLDAERVADRWLKENKSSFDKAELTANINHMIELSNSSAWGDVINLAKETAKKLSENSERKRSAASLNDLTMGIFSEIVNNRESVRLSDLAQLEAENAQYRRQAKASADYNSFLKKELNRDRKQVTEDVNLARAEAADRTKNLEAIRRTVRSLDSKLRTNSNVKHVPEGLQSAIRSFCSIFVRNDSATFKREDFGKLARYYRALVSVDAKTKKVTVKSEAYLEEIENLIEETANILNGKKLRQLTNFELICLREISQNLLSIVNDENTIFLKERKEELQEIGDEALYSLRKQKDKLTLHITSNEKIESAMQSTKEFLGVGNLKPIYFFEQLGEPFDRFHGYALEAQDDLVMKIQNARTFAQEQLDSFHYWEWIDAEPIKLKLSQGWNIELTTGEALSLYATWKRENSNTIQGSKHLPHGGFLLKRKEIIKKTKADGTQSKLSYDKNNSQGKRFTDADFEKLSRILTAEQKVFVNTMVDYLSNDMAALGNKVTMELYGIKRFKEDYYFPYNIDTRFLTTDTNSDTKVKKQTQKITNPGFAKQTTADANAPIIIGDFLEIWSKHVDEMCQYSTMTIPIRNMRKLFNYAKSTEGATGDTARSVRAEIRRMGGKEAENYFARYLDDLEGGIISSPGDEFFRTMAGKFKKNSVLFNASVVVQQPSAICRAFSVIDPKYFVKTTFKIAEKNYAELKKYCPVAVLKEIGRFDTGTGSQFSEWIIRRSYEGIKEKGKAFFTDSEYRDDVLSSAAAKADEMTWAHIWAAAKAQIAATKNIKVGTEEFYGAAAKLFNEAIEKTQVYDSVLTKSQNMRSKSSFTQMATAFMAEPTTTLNMLWKATNEVKNHNVKAAGKIVGSVVCSILFNAILKSFVTAARDDDEEKSYAEKYLQEVIANFTGDIGIWNMIPVVKDAASIFEGYTVDRTDVSLVEDLVKGVKALSSDNYTDWEKFKSVIGPIAAFFGLPVKNVIRDAEAAWNMVVSFIEGRIFASGTEMKYAALGALPWGDDSSSHYYELLYEAQHSGDEERYQEVYNYLISKGKDESDIRTGIRKFYRESKEIERQMESYEEKIVRMTYYNKLEEDKKKNVLNRIRTYLVDKAISQDTGEELSDASKKAAAAEERGANAAVYMLASAGFEDIDKSGGISKAEKIAAINKMDISQTEKIILISMYTDTSKKK